jgi:Protein of unknown function (DUF2752)
VIGNTPFDPKPPGGKHEPLIWRVGISGSILMLLAFLPLPLHPRVSLCGFLWLTGRPCPFCGLTRALACLLKGDFALALNFHPLSPLALTALLIVFLGGPCRMVWGRTGLPVPKASLRFFWAGSLLLFLVYGSWRICIGNHS